MDTARPAWLDLEEYPFAPHFFRTEAGALHYVDEGTGAPIVFVHGNPMWSFQFRNQVKALSGRYRCIAPDHLGFGLSDKPYGWDYLPAHHAAHLEGLLDSLDLTDLTLVVNDWGGPIGLSYAVHHPDRVRNLVVSNTWMWSVKDRFKFRMFSGLLGGFVGRALIKRRNLFANRILKTAFGDPNRLTPHIHEQYLRPLGTPEDRKGSWVFPRQIIGSSEWLASLWAQRGVLGKCRVLLAWGMKDGAFDARELAQWTAAFPQSAVARYEDGGHFVSEELPAAYTRDLQRFLMDSST
jgi:pimeloyl-ACP methyl ester carboxylesterase